MCEYNILMRLFVQSTLKSAFVLLFGRDLFFHDVIAVERNDEQSMVGVRVKQSEKVKSIQYYYHQRYTRDVHYASLQFFFRFLP